MVNAFLRCVRSQIVNSLGCDVNARNRPLLSLATGNTVEDKHARVAASGEGVKSQTRTNWSRDHPGEPRRVPVRRAVGHWALNATNPSPGSSSISRPSAVSYSFTSPTPLPIMSNEAVAKRRPVLS